MAKIKQGYQPTKNTMEEKCKPPQKLSTQKQDSFIQFKTRGNKLLYIRPRDIAAFGAHVDDGTQTRIFVKDVIEQLIIEDTPENILDTIVKLERK